MIASADYQKTVRDRNRLFYGVDVDIEPHPGREVRQGKQIFPLQVCRWRVGDVRHSVLLEPIIREYEYGALWPLSPMKGYRLDDDAMRQQLRRFVQSTLLPPTEATPA